MPDGIKITERWRDALSYGRCHCSSAGHDGFQEEITQKYISVTAAGTRYKTLNITRKCVLFSRVLPTMI